MDRRPKTRPSCISVAFWNANGLAAKTLELRHFMEEHHLDVVLVSETHLHKGNKAKIPNYELYRKDRPDRPGGGTGIYVRSTIDHYETDTPKLVNVEANSVVIRTTTGDIRFTSVYKPPKLKLWEKDLCALTSANSPTIIAGDLNSKDQSWNSRISNSNGKILRDFADTHHLSIYGPSEPTHYNTIVGHQADVLDICITKCLAEIIDPYTVNDLSSDHNPVLFHLRGTVDNTGDTRLTRVDWSAFQEHLDSILKCPSNINDVDTLDCSINDFNDGILQAIEHATRIVVSKAAKYKLPSHILYLIRARRRARRLWQMQRDPASRTAMNTAIRELKEALWIHRNSQWDEVVERLSTEDNSLWKMARLLRKKRQPIPPIRHQAGTAYTEEDKAEIFASCLQDQFSPNNEDINLEFIEKINTVVREFLNLPETIPPEDDFTTPARVAEDIRSLNVRKAPGPDSISNIVLKHLTPKAVVTLTQIFNAATRLQHFPTQWRNADVIVIPKNQQNRFSPQGYRPISLLSCVGKLFEKLLLSRLNAHIESSSLIPDEQFGFRPKHSCVHQLLRVVETITYGFERKMNTGAVFLDVSKAFDKVWHNGLIFKLLESGADKSLVRTLHSYLGHRSFQVKLGSVKSSTKYMTAGVPQGSLLSPSLFNVYLHDIPKTPGSTLCQYADDTAILARAYQPMYVTCILQDAIDQLEEYFKKWRISINGAKSKAVLFSRHTRKTAGLVQWGGTDLQWSPTAKYLGVVLDRRLNWVAQCKAVRNKATAARQALSPLLYSRSRLSLENRLKLYKCIVRPALTYAAPIWAYGLSRAQRKVLCSCENRFLRLVAGAPWFVRNFDIRRDLRVPDIVEHMRALAETFLRSAETHVNALVREAVSYDMNEVTRVARPKGFIDPRYDLAIGRGIF